MEVIILGSGTYQPELTRHASSYLVKIKSKNLVFDFGRGALGQLLKVGIEYYDIDQIFISHTHPDHCSELSSFLHIALSEPRYGKFRKADLTIYGPKGIKQIVSYLFKAFNFTVFKPKYKILIKELTRDKIIQDKDYTIKNFEASHDTNINCLCYKIKSRGKVLAYSGDTRDCAGLRKACQGADLAIIEASWPQKSKYGNHLTGSQAAQIAQEAKVKKLVLTHVAPYYLKHYNVVKEAKKYFKGPVSIAKDLKKIKIKL